MKTIRVYLVDDERLVREGLRMRLNMERDLAVVGDAADSASAMIGLVEARPDVVVMDVELPEIDGATRARAAANGAAAFVSKQASDQSLLDAIREAAIGRNGHRGAGP
jgi:DNA-binding NarL/FixJ family response regulator